MDHQHNCTLPNPEPENWENMTYPQRQHFEEDGRWRCLIPEEKLYDYCEGRSVITISNRPSLPIVTPL